MQPNGQTIVDPQTLALLASQLGGDQAQAQPPSTENMLQLYNVISQHLQGNSGVSIPSFPSSNATSDNKQPYGPAPKGMTQSQWNGLCEAYAEQMTFGHTGMYPSATAAAQHYSQTGQLKQDMNNAKPGDLVYLYDPNQPNGHVGIMGNNGTFTSATYNGVQTNPLQAWTQQTGQQVLGYVPLGR